MAKRKKFLPPALKKHAKRVAVNPTLEEIALQFKGTPKSIADQVGNFVMGHLPNSAKTENHKTRIFQRSAAEIVERAHPIGRFHCVDRSTLAISLLHASHVPAWVVRGIGYNQKFGKWIFHDAVEFVHNREIHTLDFFFDENRHTVTKGPAEDQFSKTHPNRTTIFLRGIDTSHLGINTWEEYEAFSNSFFKRHQDEVRANLSRIEQMAKHGVIPKEVAQQLISNAKKHLI